MGLIIRINLMCHQMLVVIKLL